MHDFLRKFVTHWRQLKVGPSETLIVAVSGGADSCALFGALVELKKKGKIDNRIIAAHFNHGLRGEDSNADEHFVQELAKRFGTEQFTGNAAPDSIEGNIEQQARRARYFFLETLANKHYSKFVLTGHTKTDQAETLIMNLIRGSGTAGLSGMKIERTLSRGSDTKLVRPLISWAERQMTEDFCRFLEIEFRNDEMNDDCGFSRVRIRKEVIPLLEQDNPKIIESLARAAETMRETQESISFLLSENSEITGRIEADSIKVSWVFELPQELRRIVIRGWLHNKLGSLRGISSAHVDAILSLAQSKKSGKTAELPGNFCVTKQSGRLELHKLEVVKKKAGDYN